MIFIDPKTDFAFKRIFGSTDSKDILISFLNALVYDDRPVIVDLEIIDPYSSSQLPGLKDSYLDVKAVTSDKTIVIIEMQVLNVAAFDRRILYNAAKTYATQLKSGEGYLKLNPVIALTLTDFVMFNHDSEVISHFVFKERTRLFDYPNNYIEMVFVELPKFQKSLEELETIQDKWIYFMKSANSLEVIPNTMEDIPEIEKALEIANPANLSPKELDELEKRVFFIEDQKGAIVKGIEEGRKQGIELGRSEGRAEGKQELILRLVSRCFGTLDPSVADRLQNLSDDRLDLLGDAIFEFGDVADLERWLEEMAG
ncbi:MAG TPA: Rpn family recombination-promoting nuclease/putative transposase [Oscillatoriales cyanobacterium M59_W2019_021]|nr:Rpn family recombination-promoting nuclease/putative transposase [Oscillatoriales cyanobacterium M4454_W2019_049]HIK52161.1 Rpn family recombination-promoting nuclease/putative transposase [Oscillatoriales cyanobacterium M59_W2019_021]